MKTFKLYGDVYEVSSQPSGPIDGYAKGKNLVDIPPKGKSIGYITMDDGSVIECYKSKPIVIMLLVILLLIGAVGSIVIYLLFLQPKDVVVGTDPNGVPIIVKQGEDNNVVSYNGFTTLDSEKGLNINFQNGDYDCTLSITGEGIESEPIQVYSGQLLENIPIKYTTDAGLVQATLTITTATSSTTQAFVIEIPENNTSNSPVNVMDDYWKGEYIYVPRTGD